MPIDILSALGTNVLAAAVIIAAVILFRALRAADTPPITAAIIDELVEAAEQMLGDASGAEKLDYVLEKARKYLPDLDEDLIRALIEAAVYRLNSAQSSARQWVWADGDENATDSTRQ